MKMKSYHLSEHKKEELIEKLSAILQERKEIAFAYVFGSFTENLPVHDVDIGLYLSTEQERPQFQYTIELSNILSTIVKMLVEATVLNNSPTGFLYHVIRGRLIFEQDNALRTQVVEDTVRRYLDHKPLLLRGIREAFAA